MTAVLEARKTWYGAVAANYGALIDIVKELGLNSVACISMYDKDWEQAVAQVLGGRQRICLPHKDNSTLLRRDREPIAIVSVGSEGFGGETLIGAQHDWRAYELKAHLKECLKKPADRSPYRPHTIVGGVRVTSS